MKSSSLFIIGGVAFLGLVAFGIFSSDVLARWGKGSPLISQEVSPLSSELLLSLQQLEAEERLAKDIYTAFYKQYGVQVFQNIANSESRHQTEVLGLLESNNILPLSDYGTLNDQYEALLAKGKISLQNAFEVGKTIEELDIGDLDTLLKKTNDPSVVFVLQNLKQGSENHLQAFTRQLLGGGNQGQGRGQGMR